MASPPPPASPSPTPSGRPLSQSFVARTPQRASIYNNLSSKVMSTPIAGPPTPGPTPGPSASSTTSSFDYDNRTAVKVAVRVRPPLNSNDPGFDLIPQRFQRTSVDVTSETEISIDSHQGRKLFIFDHVFDQTVTQEGVWEYLSDSVSAFLQGYNVSLLAYGQSGAGKSFTMGTSGPSEQSDPDLMGVIPRAASALFEHLGESRPARSATPSFRRGSMSHLRSPAKGGNAASSALGDRNWSLRASYVEIYNEQLRDLLIPESVPAADRSQVTIREDVKGNILLTGLRQLEINSIDDLMNALNHGSSIRQTDATAINAKSSRSHAVFSLNLIQRKSGSSPPPTDKRASVSTAADLQSSPADGVVTTDSKLHFVDLAGSERLKNTGAQGDRAKEGISINAGLAALGKVISQLSSRSAGSHVSYRDSKLTRLLQDSLGGNAITYMIACVTPAEFHLSETLNTVQYAQRARAIQSKPRIQQIENDDKHAVIERLKAEVSYLRDQVRNVGDTRSLTSDPSTDREAELQEAVSQLEEKYSSLQHRYGRLVTELAKARQKEQDLENQAENGMERQATDRLNLSNSFAQAVEQVVLEYEKTIQNLEHTLSSTRGSLSTTEAKLLERETKCAYIETINSQLQSRIQKLMDRESNTENYLHDLETKLDQHTSGEEKNAMIITELRKEITRVRENETACEDYISTLEERLAESDQDTELMQREIDRLEQVIERQRSLGKLDFLLTELDQLQNGDEDETDQDSTKASLEERSDSRASASFGRRPSASASVNGGGGGDHTRSMSHVSRYSTADVIPEDDEDEMAIANGIGGGTSYKNGGSNGPPRPSFAPPSSSSEHHRNVGYMNGTGNTYQSHAQIKQVTDKLDHVTQELVDLRVEHEATMNEHELLQAKYEEALRSLAQLQDFVDETRYRRQVRNSVLSVQTPMSNRPESIFSDPRLSYIQKNPSADSSVLGRSLSSELGTIYDEGRSPTPQTAQGIDGDGEMTMNGTPDSHTSAEGGVPSSATSQSASSPPSSQREPSNVEKPLPEIKDASPPTSADTSDATMAAAAASTTTLTPVPSSTDADEAAEKELESKYHELEARHNQTLDLVEELKTAVAKAQAAAAAAGTSGSRLSQPIIRRKSSQNVVGTDRAQRSFASLRNLAADTLQQDPDRLQSFELNLNAAMHELHSRSERIQELEADLSAAKKEMEAKMTIINGLTRERSSLQSSPRDISVVSTLKDQLERSEAQLRLVREQHEAKEQAFSSEIAQLQSKLDRISSSVDTVTHGELHEKLEARVSELESALAASEQRHRRAIDMAGQTEASLREAIHALESELAYVHDQLKAQQQEAAGQGQDKSDESEQKNDANLVHYLRTELSEYKVILASNATQIADAQRERDEVLDELSKATEYVEEARGVQHGHEQRILELENSISSHQQTIQGYQDQLRDLQTKHTEELQKVREMEQKGYEEQISVLLSEHAENVRLLESDLGEIRDELSKIADTVGLGLNLPVALDNVGQTIDWLVKQYQALKENEDTSQHVQKQLDDLTVSYGLVSEEFEKVTASLVRLIPEDCEHAAVRDGGRAMDIIPVIERRVTDLDSRIQKQTRLVQELEDQLQANFDATQATNNRMTCMQTERNTQVDEANAARAALQAELDALKEEYANFQLRVKSASPDMSGRRSPGAVAALASLPSPTPPPAIPLPPLPTSSSPPPGGTNANSNGANNNNNNSKKNSITSQMQQDQEAHLRTIEKHLDAEKQLTAALEEALSDLESRSNQVRADCEAWRKRAIDLERELKEAKEKTAAAVQAAAAAAAASTSAAASSTSDAAPHHTQHHPSQGQPSASSSAPMNGSSTPVSAHGQQDARWSVQGSGHGAGNHTTTGTASATGGEEERKKRAAESARAHLEERMNALNKKKKKGSLNCF